jgi:phosphatidate phosphatase APP1
MLTPARPPAVAFLVTCCLAASAARAGPGIVLAPAVGSRAQLTVTGRALAEAPSPDGSKLGRNLRRLSATPWEGAFLELRAFGQQIRIHSGHDGEFSATFDAPADRPFPAGMSEVEAKLGEVVERAPVEIVSEKAPFVVISDFDDTVAVSNVLSKRKLLATTLLDDEQTHPVVEGMPLFYGCLRANKDAPPGFALVSGSPTQLAPRIRGFLSRHSFPFMGLLLRNIGPSTLSRYKQPRIRELLRTLPHRAILVGDSGEQDPEVYAEIRKEVPDRVLEIYIRQVPGADHRKERFEGMQVFSDPLEAARHAASRGYLQEQCLKSALPARGSP